MLKTNFRHFKILTLAKFDMLSAVIRFFILLWQISLAAKEFEDVDARWVREVEG